jgi:hypothetical protein
MLRQLAVLDPENDDRYLRLVRTAADASVDGYEIVAVDDQSGLVE